MLVMREIRLWGHRPPNKPQWRVIFNQDGFGKTRFVFAEDEMAAWADTLRWLRWKEETFENSDSQNP